MIWKIAKKEFLLNLMTFKFAVGTILCVVLMAVFMPVLVNDYQQRLKDYNKNVAVNQEKLREVKAYMVLTPTIYRPPNILSVFSEGLEKRLGNSAKIELGSIPEINAKPSDVNPYLSIFPTLDVSLIFNIVLSILALLVAYDVISGERERGTLRLIMSSSIACHRVLLGKILAGLMTLIVPVTIAFIVGLLIFFSFPMVELACANWVRLGLMYFASLIFISAMYNVGLFFSCVARKSAISLVLGLFVWIIFVIVIPNGSVSLSRRIQPLKSKKEKASQIKSLEEKFMSELKEMKKSLPPGGVESDRNGPFGKEWYVGVCTPSGVERWKKRGALTASLKIKYAEKFWEVEHNYLNNLSRQQGLAGNFSRLSPISLYDNVLTTLAGTDLSSFQHFMEQTRIHRDEVIEYIRSKTNDFSLTCYFTPSKQEDWIEYEKNWRSGKEFINSARPLNLQDIPKFVHTPDVARSLERVIPDLTLLIFINVLFFALSFVAFIRYDVR